MKSGSQELPSPRSDDAWLEAIAEWKGGNAAMLVGLVLRSGELGLPVNACGFLADVLQAALKKRPGRHRGSRVEPSLLALNVALRVQSGMRATAAMHEVAKAMNVSYSVVRAATYGKK